MGAGQSTASQAPSRGLHVLRVTPHSPASETNIEPFFDFIIGFKGDDTLTDKYTIDAAELEKIVEDHVGRNLNLLVWNTKNQKRRVVPIVPSREWSFSQPSVSNPQEPDAVRKPSLLGLSMRMCDPASSLDNVWHVLDVYEGSPAESAGLVPYGDWIIGWSGGVLSAEGDFYDVVEAHIEKPLRVYVYSYDFDTIREVVLVPNRHWGGEGLLGCVFGYVLEPPVIGNNCLGSGSFGLLHRIPPVPENRDPGAIPEELLDPPDEFEEQQLFVPADVATEVELPEQAEARMRWEQEEWDRASYARNSMRPNDSPSPGNQTSPSAYDDSSEFEDVSHSSGSGSIVQVGKTSSVNSDNAAGPSEETPRVPAPIEQREIVAPIAVRATPRRDTDASVTTTTPTTATRSSSFSLGRASTPTPTRPFGSYMNGNAS
ncbi:hypothetical protein K474DRAFT_1249409 [Panus rudis PR-1116 ss-1]|nr:hypothetical protein K474DRAFT_1249409 [Panus rudis PR-1116 ss-1]